MHCPPRPGNRLLFNESINTVHSKAQSTLSYHLGFICVIWGIRLMLLGEKTSCDYLTGGFLKTKPGDSL